MKAATNNNNNNSSFSSTSSSLLPVARTTADTAAAVVAARRCPSGETNSNTATNVTPTSPTAPTSSSSSSSNLPSQPQQPSSSASSSSSYLPLQLDFIGPSQAVKDLFALPYTTEREVSVALHNMDGTLLIDADPRFLTAAATAATTTTTATTATSSRTTGVSLLCQQQQQQKLLPQQQQRRYSRRRRPRPDPYDISPTCYSESIAENSSASAAGLVAPIQSGSSLLVLPSIHSNQSEDGCDDDDDKEEATDDQQQSEALALVASVISDSQKLLLTLPNAPVPSISSNSSTRSTHPTNSYVEAATSNHHSSLSSQQQQQQQQPRPEEYVQDVLPPIREPREYLAWKFREYNMLVGTEAIIYRHNDVSNATNENHHNNNSSDSSNSFSSSPSSNEPLHGDIAPTKALPTTTSPSASSTTGTTSSSTASSSSVQALTVRVEDVSTIRSLMVQHHDLVRKGGFVPDYHLPPWQQRGKPSYAQAVAATSSSSNSTSSKSWSSKLQVATTTTPALSVVAGSFAAPNLDQERLQTCMVPSYRSPLGGLLASPTVTASRHDGSSSTSTFPSTATTSATASPVCTVLDAYLDNIMANVPQLALCLRERGFIQSVKLLQTDDIPSGFLHPTTLDLSIPFANVVVPKQDNSSKNSTATADDALFSPQIMEMNAATLLRFLKANCTRDNVTYLLRRPVNQTNIELYDISSISTQRQRQWLWWLATMSYRFALRLGHLTTTFGSNTNGNSTSGVGAAAWQARQAQVRSFRLRQRSLFQNALDLLEDLRDMDGGAHETLVGAICEHLADSYLTSSSSTSSPASSNNNNMESFSSSTLPEKGGVGTKTTEDPKKDFQPMPQQRPSPSIFSEQEQPYAGVTVDALNKAQDLLLRAIQILKPLLRHMSKSPALPKKTKKQQPVQRGVANKTSSNLQQQLVVSDCPDEDDDDVDEDDVPDDECEEKDSESDGDETISFPTNAVTLQLVGLHHKLINVALQLAEHHLQNYWSSSAMQSLRMSARHLSEATTLLLKCVVDVNPLGVNNDDSEKSSQMIPPSPQQEQRLLEQYQQSLQIQYTRLWEHCGHFARSFAGDENWRERGHASGDDVISLLQDVEAAFVNQQQKSQGRHQRHKVMANCDFASKPDPLLVETNGMVSLQSLSALIDHSSMKRDRLLISDPQVKEYQEGLNKATRLFLEQGQIARDKRRVLVAACVSYGRSITAYKDLFRVESGVSRDRKNDSSNKMQVTSEPFLILLQQRIGDTCNEIGKVLLTQLRLILTSTTNDCDDCAADVVLSSAEFWFMEGLRSFTECLDLRNVALLRCNLCQCYKLRANSKFAKSPQSPVQAAHSSSHAESCLEQAVHHLESAHEALGVRDTDSRTWDMVSEELASTFLVLGVRRRQSLLGGGTTPIVLQTFRLTPGKEKLIVNPMERSLSIYQQLGNSHQAAAVHYQLALFYSKVWTCQRDESKTREKLSAAFRHFSSAHSYFCIAPPGNEPTFVLLCLDLSGLYSAVSGKECLEKALSCCLDTCDAFAERNINTAAANTNDAAGWFEKMETLASTLEERVFKLLKELVKLERETSPPSSKFKELYRTALITKAASKPNDADHKGVRLLATHKVLSLVKFQASQ